MKAPDKIYLSDFQLKTISIRPSLDPNTKDFEYIRKDALMEWVKSEVERLWELLPDAANVTSISSDTIRMCCCHKIKSAGGYIWSFSPDFKQPYSTTEKDLSASRKKVGQYNMSGELINTYDSITEASNAVKCTISNIGHSLNGRTKSSAGYIWKYIDARQNERFYGDEDKTDL